MNRSGVWIFLEHHVHIESMKYFALLYKVIDGFTERRAQFRMAHLQLAEQWSREGKLLFGGALGEPVDRALLVFRVPDAESVEEFVHTDPYVSNGLVRQWEVQPWAVVVGRFFTGNEE